MLQNASYTLLGQLYVTSAAEQQHWSPFSVFLLSLAGLGVLWIRRDALSKLWMHLDRACVSVFLPSFSNRDKLVKWAQARLPNQWSSLRPTLSGGVSDLWYDGSLLCAIINTAVPGACPNPHKHWKKPPAHAQELAFKYLGLTPMFTEIDLQNPLKSEHEQNFLRFLTLLRKSIDETSRDKLAIKECSKHYVARGMGLYAGEQHKESVFYIYPQINPCCYYKMVIYIQGPYSTYGRMEFSYVTSEDSKIYRNVLSNGLCTKLDNKTGAETVKIKVTIEDGRARVAYVPNNHGIYEVFIESNGEPIVGSPYYVNVFQTPIDNVAKAKIRQNLLSEHRIDDELDSYIQKQLSSCTNHGLNLKNNKDLKNLCNITKKSISNNLVDKFLEKKNHTHFPVKINLQASRNNETSFQSHPISNISSLSASPICPDHIAPEDFAKVQYVDDCQSALKDHSADDRNSSCSDKENAGRKATADVAITRTEQENVRIAQNVWESDNKLNLQKEKSRSMTNLEPASKCSTPASIKKYKSMDHSLDACSVEPIQKRRLEYLKQATKEECRNDKQSKVDTNDQDDGKKSVQFVQDDTEQDKYKSNYLTFKEARNYFKFLEETAKKPFRTIVEMDKFVYSKDRIWYQTINSCHITRTNRLRMNRLCRNALTAFQRGCFKSSVVGTIEDAELLKDNILKYAKQKKRKELKSVFDITY